MATTLSEMIPTEQRFAFGLSIRSLSLDITPPRKSSSSTIFRDTGGGEGSSDKETKYTLTLIQESGQIFQLRDLDFTNGIAPLVNLRFGELDIIATVVSWEETLIDINGNSIFTVVLTSNGSIFLKSFKVVEASYVTEPQLVNNNILVPTVIINGKTFGPSIQEIFALFTDQTFTMAENTIFFNFNGLDTDLNVQRLIEVRSGETSLYDIIEDFTKANNFDYSLKFELVNGNMGISFLKTGLVDESSTLSMEFDNILDAIANADSDKVISFRKGYTITENFVQQHGDGIPKTDFLTQKIIHVVKGGFTSNLLNYTLGDITQFWGFNSNGELLDEPDNIDKMNDILNNKDTIEDDIELRKFMNLWGRQYAVNASRYTEILPLTPEQEEDIANEQQAMIDLIQYIIDGFNQLPIRNLGDPYRNGISIFRSLVDQYLIFNTDPTEDAISNFLRDVYRAPGLGSSFPIVSPYSIIQKFEDELNSTSPNYPSVDEVIILTGTSLALNSSINLENARVIRTVPSGTDISSYAFANYETPLVFRSPDGRTPSYIELPELPENVGRTTNAWSSKIISSTNYAGSNDINLLKVNVIKQKGHFIITLPGQAMIVSKTTILDQGNGESGDDVELSMAKSLNNFYLSAINTKERYGPFIVLDGQIIDEQSDVFISALNDPKYKIVNIVDDRLVPERFSNNGTFSRSESIEEMKLYIAKNVNSLNSLSPISQSFGTLEVAGLPRREAFDGTIFPDGAMISRISISFSVDGIKTIYYITSEPIVEKEKPEIEAMPDDETLEDDSGIIESDPVVIDETELPHDLEQNALSDQEMEYIYKKPAGGLGVVVGKEGVTGPFYFVRRLNYADIDPETYAGGLNITESYFLSEWHNVRNLAEPEDSFGYILPGTRVTVSIFSEGEHRPQVAYFEQNPQVFAPPIEE